MTLRKTDSPRKPYLMRGENRWGGVRILPKFPACIRNPLLAFDIAFTLSSFQKDVGHDGGIEGIVGRIGVWITVQRGVVDVC